MGIMIMMMSARSDIASKAKILTEVQVSIISVSTWAKINSLLSPPSAMM